MIFRRIAVAWLVLMLLVSTIAPQLNFFHTRTPSSTIDNFSGGLLSKTNQRFTNEVSTNYNKDTEIESTNLGLKNLTNNTSSHEINEYRPTIINNGIEPDYQGLNIFQRINFSINGIERSSSFLITDMEGNPIYEKVVGRPAEGIIQAINSTTMLLFAPSDQVYFWNIYTDELTAIPILAHHDVTYNPFTQTFLALGKVDSFIDGQLYLYDTVDEYSLDGTQISSWPLFDIVPLEQWNGIEFAGPGNDITHANTLFWDMQENMIYLMLRNTNTFYKINYETKEVIWSVGQYGDYKLIDENGNERSNLFYHAHSLEKIDDNTFIMFDNDFLNQTNAFNQQSRILELQLDHNLKTATIGYSWKGNETYFSNIWGDADRLPNGNRIGTFGTEVHPGTTIGARIVEVNEEGDIVWEMQHFPKDGFAYGIYRMDRIFLAPLAEPQSNTQFTSDEEVSFSWDTWYNFRSLYTVNGKYDVYLNGNLYESSNWDFPAFWQSKQLTVDFGIQQKGSHNVTLVLYDEGNHPTIKTTIISVDDFFVNQEPFSNFEQGDAKGIIEWKGKSAINVTGFIFLNGTEIRSFDEDQLDQLYDARNLDPGKYQVDYVLTNDTQEIFREVLIFHVYNSEPPNIQLIGIQPSYVWGDAITYTITVEDQSPNTNGITLSLLMDQQVIDISQILWDSQSLNLTENLPILNEGTYSLKFTVTDATGRSSEIVQKFVISPPLNPVIVANNQYEFYWNEANQSLQWEIHGGSQYSIYRNQTLFLTGNIDSQILNIDMVNWRQEEWLLGHYNITIVVVNNQNIQSSSTSIIEIDVNFGDGYADIISSAETFQVLDPENALSKPDSKYAQIFAEYGSGYLTYDFGENEKIVDDFGPDLLITATGGKYRILTRNSLNDDLTVLTEDEGITQLDLASYNVDEIRFLRIEYIEGDFILLDAVQAISFASNGENDDPKVSGDTLILFNRTRSLILNWSASDTHPYKYRIIINDSLLVEDFWDSSLIQFSLIAKEGLTYSIKIEIFDIQFNMASFLTIVLYQEIDVQDQKESSSKLFIFGIFVLSVFLYFSLFVLRILIKKRKFS